MDEEEELKYSELRDVLVATAPTPPIVVKCNKLAMDYMRRGNLDYSHQLLIKAKKFLESSIQLESTFSEQDHCRLLSLTMNNLGCLYKK